MANYSKQFQDYLLSIEQKQTPKGLYAPIDYLLALGAKRIRPTLTLMATEALKETLETVLPQHLQ